MKDNRFILTITPTLKYFFILLSVFKPDTLHSLSSIRVISDILTIIKYSVLFLLCVRFMINKSRIKLPSMLYPLLIGIIGISTIINGNYTSLPRLISSNIDISLFYLLACYSEENNEHIDLLNSAYAILALWCIGNTISVIAFYDRRYMYIPDTVSAIARDRYLLGSKNYQILFILPFLGIGLMRDLELFDKIRLRTLLIQIIAIIPLVMTVAATSIFTVITFYALILFGINKERIFDRLYVSWWVLITTIVFFVSAAVMQMQIGRLTFIESIFGKSIKSQRFLIWSSYIKKIINKPIIGYGYMNDELQKLLTGIVHAHNLYLQVLFRGGVIGLIIFMIFLLSLLSRSAKSDSKLGVIAFSSTAAMMLAFEGDYYYSMAFYFVIVLILCHESSILRTRQTL